MWYYLLDLPELDGGFRFSLLYEEHVSASRITVKGVKRESDCAESLPASASAFPSPCSETLSGIVGGRPAISPQKLYQVV
jgi:hypothetical protein